LDLGSWILDLSILIPRSAFRNQFTVTRSCGNLTRLRLLIRFLKKQHLKRFYYQNNKLPIICRCEAKVNSHLTANLALDSKENLLYSSNRVPFTILRAKGGAALGFGKPKAANFKIGYAVGNAE